MRQDEVLRVGDANVVIGVAFGEVGNDFHLKIRRIARRAADRLQADGDGGMARLLVRVQVYLRPLGKIGLGGLGGLERLRAVCGVKGRRGKIGMDAVDLGLWQVDLHRDRRWAAYSASTWRVNSLRQVR
jgi:hypothetical protein